MTISMEKYVVGLFIPAVFIDLVRADSNAFSYILIESSLIWTIKWLQVFYLFPEPFLILAWNRAYLKAILLWWMLKSTNSTEKWRWRKEFRAIKVLLSSMNDILFKVFIFESLSKTAILFLIP